MPAKAGIRKAAQFLDAGFHRHDVESTVSQFSDGLLDKVHSRASISRLLSLVSVMDETVVLVIRIL